jgi:four helix bundle protein
MVAVRRFEDLVAWQKARELTKLIYEASRRPSSLGRDRELSAHLRESSISVMSNTAEGFARRTAKEFTQFLFIAKASAAEIQSLLYVALDQNYLNEDEFSKLYGKTDEVARIISGLITSIRKRGTQ